MYKQPNNNNNTIGLFSAFHGPQRRFREQTCKVVVVENHVTHRISSSFHSTLTKTPSSPIAPAEKNVWRRHCVHRYTHTHTHAHIHTHTRTYTHTHTHFHIYTHMSTRTRPHTHTHTHSLSVHSAAHIQHTHTHTLSHTNTQ